jgi:cytidylate kinase
MKVKFFVFSGKIVKIIQFFSEFHFISGNVTTISAEFSTKKFLRCGKFHGKINRKEPEAQMKKYVTISREFASGGHTIAGIVAKELGIPFYDSEIIDKAAEDSGLSPDFIKKNEQNISSGWLYSLLLGASYASPGTNSVRLGMNTTAAQTPLADQIFNAQRNAIIQFAKKGPCVLVGRCSDYILRNCEEIDRQEVINFFIYAPLKDKVNHAIKTKGLNPATAERDVKLIDKRRANHYNTFTERTWGNRSHYDMLINSSLLGMEKTAKLIADIVRNT